MLSVFPIEDFVGAGLSGTPMLQWEIEPCVAIDVVVKWECVWTPQGANLWNLIAYKFQIQITINNKDSEQHNFSHDARQFQAIPPDDHNTMTQTVEGKIHSQTKST